MNHTPEEVAALKRRIAELEAKVAELDEYRKMWEHYDRIGILPPRTCEMEEAVRSGRTLDSLIDEMTLTIPKEERLA